MRGPSILVPVGVAYQLLEDCVEFIHSKQTGEIDHVSSVDVVKEVPRLVERAKVVWRAVVVHDEHPAEPLLTEMGGKVHENRAQRGNADHERAAEEGLVSKFVGAPLPEGDKREHHNMPAWSLRNGVGELPCEPLVAKAVNVWKVWSVLSFVRPGHYHDGLIPRQRAELAGVHFL